MNIVRKPSYQIRVYVKAGKMGISQGVGKKIFLKPYFKKKLFLRQILIFDFDIHFLKKNRILVLKINIKEKDFSFV